MTNQVQAVQMWTLDGGEIIDAHGVTVATVEHPEAGLLLAAAPELLEALKETLRALKQHLSDEAAEHNMKHVSALCACWENEVQRARAAIANAEGRAL